MTSRGLLVVLALVGCAQPHFRLSDDGTRLEARVVTLRDASGREVVLPAMLHVAEPAFYADVGGRVGRCDVVFGEGVRSDDDEPATVAPSASASTAPVDSVLEALVGPATRRYPLIAAQLGLALQPPLLPGARADRLRNADMTWGELQEALTPEERAGLNLAAPGAAAAPPGEGDLALAGIVTLATITRMTRAELAQRLASGEEPDIDLPTIAGARERRVAEAALRALEEPGVRSIAIVYGGGHQRGLTELLEDSGFELAAEAWVRVFAVDDAAGARRLSFGVEDVVVVRGPEFEVELAWGMPVQERLFHALERGEALGELEPLLYSSPQPLLVRARDAAGRPVERPFDAGPVALRVEPTPAAEVGASMTTSTRTLVLRGRPVGVWLFDELRPGWQVSMGPRGGGLTDRLTIERVDDEARPWQLSLPEGRHGSRKYRVEVLAGANGGGRWLDRLGR